MDLLIVESPTKARTLSKFLGADYLVEATMGHIKDLPKSTLGIDVDNNFTPEYLLIPKKEPTVSLLQKAAKDSTKIYIATDPDREGEAIAFHVGQIFGNRKSKRIVFHEITKEAVEEALLTPRDIDQNLVDAQIARRVLDRLVGYKLSPLLWKKVRRGLSAGRVQSVAVRLIVEREAEIEKFKADEYWEIFCNVKVQNTNDKFTIQLIKEEIKSKDAAEKIVSDLERATYIVSDVRKREIKKNSFPPFTTSTMTQAGARVFGWSAKKTMRTAQGLYEEGLITYHRTDSLSLARSAVERARGFIKKEFGESYLPDVPKFYKTTSKSAQEAHEAIRPTDVTLKDAAQHGRDAGRLYDIIWRRFVASQMNPSIYDETTIDVGAGKYLLRASGQIMRFDGWRKVLPSKLTEEGVVKLPEVEKDDKLKLLNVNPQQKFTQPPPRFNEASLIKTLEKLGIGRPSTYAPIISTIQIRQYVEKDEGKFKPTSVGVAVTLFLVDNFPKVFDYDFTAEMEEGLDKVAEGTKKWEKEIKEFWNPFSGILKLVEKNAKRVKIETEKLGKKCPDCEKARLAGDESRRGELVIRLGRFGKFISCSLFPECKYTAKYIEKTGAKCPECKEGDVILKRSGKGRKFFGCSRYPDCKWASWRKPGNEKT